MNQWLQLSIEYANQRSYLDDLYDVYPIQTNPPRELSQQTKSNIAQAYFDKDCEKLVSQLLDLNLFPIKDSYIAYLRKDRSAIYRNKATVQRICDRLFNMGLENLLDRCCTPIESNRQLGQRFHQWLRKGSLGIKRANIEEFLDSHEDAILDEHDSTMKSFAKNHLNYAREKGLDFIARINNQYIIGEAKFLTEYGGHQLAQFNDALTLLKTNITKALPIAILDGVLYIKGKHKMYRSLTNEYSNENIMSALILRDFLSSI